MIDGHPANQAPRTVLYRRSWLPAAATLFAGFVPAGGQEMPRLRLSETHVRALPASSIVLGGRISGNGDVLVWDENTVWYGEPNRSTLFAICAAHVRQPLAAALPSNETSDQPFHEVPPIEILDTAHSSRVKLKNGVTCSSEPIPTAIDQLTSAAYSKGRWVLVRRLEDKEGRGSAAISAFRQASISQKARLALPASLTLLRDSTPLLVTSHDDGLIIGGRRPPFTWLRINDAHETDLVVRSIPPETPRSGDWVSTGVFPLDEGYVQVLADLRSDRRMLVLYDSSGTIMRQRFINAPIGIVATAPARRELIAVRRTNSLALVTYEWSWMQVAR